MIELYTSEYQLTKYGNGLTFSARKESCVGFDICIEVSKDDVINEIKEVVLISRIAEVKIL